jgi:hypothetical protein
MFLILYLQPDLIATTIGLFSCRTIGDKSYVLINVANECFNDNYYKYSATLVLPLLLLWAIVFPLLMFFKLKSHKHCLNKTDTMVKLGFLYREYKHSTYYWEFMKLAEKILIIIVLNFYS